MFNSSSPISVIGDELHCTSIKALLHDNRGTHSMTVQKITGTMPENIVSDESNFELVDYGEYENAAIAFFARPGAIFFNVKNKVYN